MRKDLEKKLFDLRFDMDLIGQEDELRKAISCLSDEELVENVHPHRFRRTFATNLAKRGMEIQSIQRLMGHTNLNTTMVYIAMDDSQLQASYKQHIA